jgi:NhaP-type Na+/H+ or K+/H+ antiporter
VTVATIAPERRGEFERFGGFVAELLKLLALLLFASVLTWPMLAAHGWREIVFAVAALVIARPAALAIIHWRSELTWRERLTAGWFGPKGFASVVYAVLVINAGTAGAQHVFSVVAVVIALSMAAHSSTDVLVARWFRRRAADSDLISIAS